MGRKAGEACRQFDASENTHYRRLKEYGGLDVRPAMRLFVLFDSTLLAHQNSGVP